MLSAVHAPRLARVMAALAVSLLLLSCGGVGVDENGEAPDPDPPDPDPPPIFGLDMRPGNSSCLAGDAPSTGTFSLGLQRVFTSVPTFSSPILMLQAPNATAAWYVVEQGGMVYSFDNQANASARRTFVNLTAAVAGASGGEAGLLGMAFHPDWPTNPRVYFSYTVSVSGTMYSRIMEYRTGDGGQTVDLGTARQLIQVTRSAGNHNGGNIAFGPDGFLYIGFGDGGGGGDGWGAYGNGQRLSTLLGKLLRIDVNGSNGAVPYAIPGSNPYAGNAACNIDAGAFTQSCPEIYAYGLRNPWRWSFDPGSGELWLGDVGQGAWEEVNRITLGGNYGWRCFEGDHVFNSNCGPNAASALRPIAEYGRSAGYSVTGGYVYRGSAIPQLAGRYVFGDFGSGRIWHIARDTSPTLQVSSGLDSGLNVSAFAQDADGEIYIVHYGGTLHRLVATTTGGGGGPPAQLSATGCVSASNATQPAAGLIPYAPNAAFWSDSATKQRFLALPDGLQIGVNNAGDFDFPSGSVLVKNFRLGARLVETRLFMRHNDGNWAGYTYEWNAQGTDATRVVGGKTVTVAGQSWLFPSEAQCLTCHTEAAGRSLGLEISQLNGPINYPATGRTANQLATLNHINTLSPALTQQPAQLPALPDPYGTAGTLTERARAYLHTNCSHCHRPGGPTNVNLDLRYDTSLALTQACETLPVNDMGVANARIIAVGDNGADRSLLVLRPERTDAMSMPPLQPRVVDTAGVALLRSWVNSLSSCN